ncbi:MAG: sigma 54-interacting transcriptional regulator, partial [Rubrivivax sp.]|nr:sigma 54-interacting transcriptional regulator [Rubrivivax sp.]
PVWTTVTEAVAEAVPTAKSRPSRSAADAPHVAGLTQLQTGDRQMQALLDKLRRVVDRDIPILIQGETGTGKALLAHAIHADSMRAQRPFVAVNCAAIPDTLIEAELFGYEEGTFAGARRNGAVGKIQQAHGGTLFLDEVGDMPLALQAHLLRVLQERQVTPLGAGKAVPAEVALICATHRRLRDRVDAKTFREDLYYRLNGLAVRVPALRDRTDLAALVRRILDGDTGGRHLQLSPEVMALFQHYPWPGNVRQLFNVLRAAVVMAGSDRYILLEHLPDDFTEDAARHAANASAPLVDAPATAVPAMPASPPQSLDALERDAIRQAVDAAGGNISEAAKRLGISRNTIYRKLRWRQSSPPR